LKILNTQKLRTRKQKKQVYIRIFFSCLLVTFVIITLTIAYEFLVSSTIFNLKNVIVDGNKLLADATIAQKADLPIGKNLFKIDTDDPKERVLALRLIESVSLRKSFPSTIVISVQERIPVALLLFNQKLFYIDNEGKLLSVVNAKSLKRLENKLDYPTITGITEAFDHSEKAKYISLSIFLLNIFKENPFLKDILISEINVNKDRGLSVITAKNSTPVLFGFDDYERKAFYLNQTLDDLKAKGIKIAEINLDFNKKVVVKQER